ncbi:MAG: hypothetical protein Q4P05_07775 [Actinomycetaceae bacterium]|nr:hypothetical protein [Actinomycetaceae bacterium]
MVDRAFELSQEVRGAYVRGLIPDNWRIADTQKLKESLENSSTDTTFVDAIDLLCVGPVTGTFAPNIVVTVTDVPTGTDPQRWAHDSARETARMIPGYRTIEMVPLPSSDSSRSAWLTCGTYLNEDSSLTTYTWLELHNPPGGADWRGLAMTMTCRTREASDFFILLTEFVDTVEVIVDGGDHD